MKTTPLLRTAMVALTLALAACGGGGGGIGGTGITTGAVTYGAITGFGSVWVNGVEYQTDAARIELDGRAVTQADLSLGMVALVQADVGSTDAKAVRVDSAVRGRVEAVAADGTLTVMGQAVRIDADTRYDKGVHPVAGDWVAIYGLAQPGGIVRASLVQQRAAPADPPFAVSGFVTSQTGTRLTIGALTVETATADPAVSPGGGWVGRLVSAQGRQCQGDPVCGTLTASRVDSSGPTLDDAEEADLEGFVTLVGPNSFELGGITVTWSSGTSFENGTAADLAIGSKLEVEGAVAGGVLVASKVDFQDDVRIEADVAGGDATGGYTLAGLPGLTVRLNASTQLNNGTPRAGDHVTLRGRAGSPGSVVASRIERGSADPQVLLRGPVQAVAPPTLTLLGLVIDLTGLESARLLERLSLGDDVLVKGQRAGASVRWEEIELDD